MQTGATSREIAYLLRGISRSIVHLREAHQDAVLSQGTREESHSNDMRRILESETAELRSKQNLQMTSELSDRCEQVLAEATAALSEFDAFLLEECVDRPDDSESRPLACAAPAGNCSRLSLLDADKENIPPPDYNCVRLSDEERDSRIGLTGASSSASFLTVSDTAADEYRNIIFNERRVLLQSQRRVRELESELHNMQTRHRRELETLRNQHTERYNGLIRRLQSTIDQEVTVTNPTDGLTRLTGRGRSVVEWR